MRSLPAAIAVGLALTGLPALTSLAVAAPPGPCAHPTILGTAHHDVLRGTPGDDVIAGLAGNDTIYGGGGDDVLCGGSGADQLHGGAGNDLLRGGLDGRRLEDTDSYDYSGDTLDGGPGDDVLSGGVDPRNGIAVDTISFRSSSRGVRVDLRAGSVRGQGHDRILRPVGVITGSPHDDTLLGSAGADDLRGGRGSDRIEGRGGDDHLAGFSPYSNYLDHDPDVVIGGPGDDTVNGSLGDDTLEGGAGKDALYGDDGADRILGGPGADFVVDVLVPGRGQVIDGGGGRDALGDLSFDDAHHGFRKPPGTLDLADARVTAAAAGLHWRATIRSLEDAYGPEARGWTLIGTSGPNTLVGGYDVGVTIRAGSGNDTVLGSNGDDLLDGGRGYDTGFGFGGHDRFTSVEHVKDPF